MTGLPLSVCPGQRNPRTGVFGSDSGPYKVRQCLPQIRVGLQAMPGGGELLKREVLKVEVMIGLEIFVEQDGVVHMNESNSY